MVKLGHSITVVDMPFMGALVTVFISFLFYIISFSSPYWLISYANAYNPFVKMGLWTVCFNEYIHPKDYKNNRFSGCFWIFNEVFYVKGFWEYIDPRWLIAIQVMVSVGLIFQCIAVICVILYFILYGNPVIESTIAVFSQGAAILFMVLSLITFGIKTEDRTWMPRPDHNFLGFSFGFACLMIFYGLLATFFLVLVCYSDRYFKFKHEMNEINDMENKSRMTYGGKSSQFRAPASYYVGTGSTKQPLLVTGSQVGSTGPSSVYQNNDM